MNKEPQLIGADGKAIASDEKLIKTFDDRIVFIKSLMSDTATFKEAVIEILNDIDIDAYLPLEQAILKATETNQWLNATIEVINTQHPSPPKEKDDFIPIPGKTEWAESFDTETKKLKELRNMVKHMISKFYSNPPITTIPSESLFGSQSVLKMMETMFWLKEAINVIGEE